MTRAESTEEMDPRALKDRVRELQGGGDATRDQLIALVHDQWGAIARRQPLADDAETCRMTMLAYYDLHETYVEEDYLNGYVWRVRSLIRAAASNYLEGVVKLIQTETFRIQGEANRYPDPASPERFLRRKSSDPDYVVVQEAYDILDEMRPFVDGALSGDLPGIIGRIYWEKRAFLLYADRRYEEAITGYSNALACAGDDLRGSTKVRGGLANCWYHLSSNDPDLRGRAISETRFVLEHSDHEQDLHKTACRNLAEMQSGGTALEPYEIL